MGVQVDGVDTWGVAGGWMERWGGWMGEWIRDGGVDDGGWMDGEWIDGRWMERWGGG